MHNVALGTNFKAAKRSPAAATLFAGVQVVRPYAGVSNEADVWDEPGA
jgi:hypothetical protein